MGLLDWINKRLFLNAENSPPISDWPEVYEVYADTHLRQSALDTVIGKIISASSLVIFNSDDKQLAYKLNAKPNDNQSANEFRSKVIKRLLLDGEALIVPVRNNLYLADAWNIEKFELKPSIYKDVVVGDMTLNQLFFANEVIHLKYHNDKLKTFLYALDGSYGKLFNRLIEVHMREQQLRVYAKFRGMTSKDAETQNGFIKYLKGLEEKLKNDSVVVAPRQDDYEIEEQKQAFLGRSISEVETLENMYVKQVANILQVPPLIFSGDLADVSQHNQNFINGCIRPLMDIWTSEFNAKYFTQKEYLDGSRLTVNTLYVSYNNEFDMAGATEKMVGSGVWTIDDILELQGKKRLDTPVTNRRYLTKNIAPLNEDGTIYDPKYQRKEDVREQITVEDQRDPSTN